MNGIGFVSFVDTGLKAIGTQDLNSCMAVIMATSKGAVLAHISPLPGPTTDPDASINHTRNMMADFWGKCQENLKGTELRNSVLVYAMFQGQVAMPEQRDYIHNVLLENMDEDQFPREYSYTVHLGGHIDLAQDTVFIDGRGDKPRLFVENVETKLLGP
ncbi:hypothetical protein BO94DRAFT_628181 [Aspergillus sclerotioniger CBS 115572]|uniref:Uncharacterized protein n=1 Tax=Aspergillus sclerotioniger CBS 115572 TaxID=1450535 RepID=A0A317VAI7_9EURO|nr:hypothetical protein BO94DRAFT_628181 [Aspergillus sclerotioniger CBS 115572]PWY71115.1 hypothetical protein BO94DRAFT_628181 [Aspergillus sclerotioniger CBS 115572]